jgi:Tripartite tricarboxylate transporter family receptor
MIVPFPAGGPTDTIGRVVAEGMRTALGQPVIIDNVGGAAGSVATGKVARATPDGYTIGLGSGTTHVANGAVYALKYDVVDDPADGDSRQEGVASDQSTGVGRLAAGEPRQGVFGGTPIGPLPDSPKPAGALLDRRLPP